MGETLAESLKATFCPECGECLAPGTAKDGAYCPLCECELSGDLSSTWPLPRNSLPVLLAWGLSPAALLVLAGLLDAPRDHAWPFGSSSPVLFLPWLAFLGSPIILCLWSAFLLLRLPPPEWTGESRLEAICLMAVMMVVNLFAAGIGPLAVAALH